MGIEECPEGEQCPIHHRYDSETVEVSTEWARIVTYVGDYVVVTDTNPFVLRGVFGQLLAREYTDRYDITVHEIGEGTLSSACNTGLELMRFHESHDDFSNIIDAHELVVEAVKQGWLVNQ